MKSDNHELSTRSISSPSTCHSSNGYNIHKPSPSTLSTSNTISSPPLLSSSKITMLSRASLAFSLRSPAPEPFPFGGDGAVVALPSLSSVLRLSKKGPRGGALVAMATDSRTLSGIVFEPFEELKREGSHLVPLSPHESLARQCYSHDCETAINVQINVEYNVSYVYHALYAYFDRDNVALKGFAKFFKESSEEEREHAEKLMKYQNKRGGRVKLHSIVCPPSEFDHPEKGDALYAMELALSLEKLTNEKLLHLQSVACNNNDPQMQDFVESEFLGEQVEAIKKISDYVSQLRRVGKGHGVWHFDQMLLHEEEEEAVA